MAEDAGKDRRTRRYFARLRQAAHDKSDARRSITVLISNCLGAVVALALLLRHWISRVWYQVISSTGRWFLHLAQTHQLFARAMHFCLNAVPDLEFLVLALAGLVYLMPALIKRVEQKRALRISVTIFFVAFGALTVIVNSIGREEDEYSKGQLNDKIASQGTKLDAVQTANGQILQYLVSNKTLSEADRRANLEKALRNEYITTHDTIDPQILAGNKLPPDDWMNRRLTELGEKWKFTSPPSPVVEAPTPPEKAVIGFSLWNDTQLPQNDRSITEEQVSPDENGVVTVHFLARNKSGVEAENVEIWSLICRLCAYASEPQLFERPPGSDDQTRHRVVGNINAGTSVTNNTLAIKVPPNVSPIGIRFGVSLQELRDASNDE